MRPINHPCVRDTITIDDAFSESLSTRLDTQGHAYYRRKLTEGRTVMEAMRFLKRRISDAVY